MKTTIFFNKSFFLHQATFLLGSDYEKDKSGDFAELQVKLCSNAS